MDDSSRRSISLSSCDGIRKEEEEKRREEVYSFCCVGRSQQNPSGLPCMDTLCKMRDKPSQKYPFPKRASSSFRSLAAAFSSMVGRKSPFHTSVCKFLTRNLRSDNCTLVRTVITVVEVVFLSPFQHRQQYVG